MVQFRIRFRTASRMVRRLVGSRNCSTLSVVYWESPKGFTGLNVGQGGYMCSPAQDGYSDGYNVFQGVRAYDPQLQTWTTPDAYAGDVRDPASQKPYMYNRNNPFEYADASGYFSDQTSPPTDFSLFFDPNSEGTWNGQLAEAAYNSAALSANTSAEGQFTTPEAAALHWAINEGNEKASVNDPQKRERGAVIYKGPHGFGLGGTKIGSKFEVTMSASDHSGAVGDVHSHSVWARMPGESLENYETATARDHTENPKDWEQYIFWSEPNYRVYGAVRLPGLGLFGNPRFEGPECLNGCGW